MLKVSDPAPGFCLPDQNGSEVSLGDFAGRRLVLYFYPRDNTPGCSREAAAFATAAEEIASLGAAVVGVSRDSVASHQRFAQKYSLPFPILSDPELSAIQPYGVWQEKKLAGRVSMGVVRTTFVIGPDGRVEQVFQKVKPDTAAQQVLQYLKGEG